MVEHATAQLVTHAVQRGTLEQEGQPLDVKGDHAAALALRVEAVDQLSDLSLNLGELCLADPKWILRGFEAVEGGTSKSAHPE